MSNFYIYRHIRPDTNEVFYIGKGNNLSSQNYIRKDWKHKRNKIWNDIVRKNNGVFTSEVLFECETESQCNEKEKEFILLYGRKNTESGTLANLTDGGEGCVGMKHSEKTIKKLSEKAKQRITPNPFKGKKHKQETKDYFRELRKENPKEKYKFINTDTKQITFGIDDTALSIDIHPASLSRNLKNNYAINTTPIMYYDDFLRTGSDGFVNKKRRLCKKLCKAVIDVESGKYYHTVKEAAIDKGLDVSTLRRRLFGTFINNTTLKYADGTTL